jgi:hypothetical protein
VRLSESETSFRHCRSESSLISQKPLEISK